MSAAQAFKRLVRYLRRQAEAAEVPQEPTYTEDDMVGPGHELYPMMRDAMGSEGPVFYERNPVTGKLEKKDLN